MPGRRLSGCQPDCINAARFFKQKCERLLFATEFPDGKSVGDETFVDVLAE
jgi:hypothetical protein